MADEQELEDWIAVIHHLVPIRNFTDFLSCTAQVNDSVIHGSQNGIEVHEICK